MVVGFSERLFLFLSGNAVNTAITTVIGMCNKLQDSYRFAGCVTLIFDRPNSSAIENELRNQLLKRLTFYLCVCVCVCVCLGGRGVRHWLPLL